MSTDRTTEDADRAESAASGVAHDSGGNGSSEGTVATAERGPSPDGHKSAGAPAKAKLGLGHSLGLILALVALAVIGIVTSGEQFASAENLMVILRQAAVIGVISIGVTFVITSGGIDLSVGSVMGLATVWASTLGTQALAEDTHWLVIVITALAVGTGAGVINGIIIAYGRVVSFIATLAMLTAARGFAEIVSGRQTQILDVQGFLDTFRGDLLGIPIIVWIFALVATGGWFLFNRTTFGRRTIAVGGNIEAARLAGIKVKRHQVKVFALAGLCAGIGAVMMLSRTTAGSSNHGYLLELDVIAAVVIGGTLLAGGRGTIVGTVLGVLVFAVLRNVFVQNNLDQSVQALATGAIIVVAVLLQQRFSRQGRT